MSAQTKIEWADDTFNPWIGCTKISDACDFCYAEDWSKRYGRAKWGNSPRQRTNASTWAQPKKWNRQAKEAGKPRFVFCASLADVFDNQVPEDWRADLWSLIKECDSLTWLLLTKRPQNIAKMLPPDWGTGWPHVWLGTTVEHQEAADRNVPWLLAVPAAKRFLSCEPLLGPIDLRALDVNGDSEMDALHADTWGAEIERNWRDTAPDWEESFLDWYNLSQMPDLNARMYRPIDWVIAGGESGPNARPSHPDWFRSLRDQCAADDVPFLFKQWGEWSPGYAEHGNDLEYDQICGASQSEWPEGHCSFRVGKKVAGRTLDGVTHDGRPHD